MTSTMTTEIIGWPDYPKNDWRSHGVEHERDTFFRDVENKIGPGVEVEPEAMWKGLARLEERIARLEDTCDIRAT